MAIGIGKSQSLWLSTILVFGAFAALNSSKIATILICIASILVSYYWRDGSSKVIKTAIVILDILLIAIAVYAIIKLGAIT